VESTLKVHRSVEASKAIWSPIAWIASGNVVERGCAELSPSPYSHPNGLLRKVGQSFECFRGANFGKIAKPI
jgi:hypothetical protein